MDIEKIKTQMCDNYCKHFEEIRATFEDIDRGQEELDRICEHCPLNELEDLGGNYVSVDDLLKVEFKNPIGLTAFRNIIKRQDAIEIIPYGDCLHFCREEDGMSRYIDADAFLKSVKQKAYPQSGSVNESERKISLFGIMEILTAMPTADVVEVVRCKDCKWFDSQKDFCHNPRWGNGWANYPPPTVIEERFCCDGERREDEEIH